MIKTQKIYMSQKNLVKISNDDLRVINEECKGLNENEGEMRL